MSRELLVMYDRQRARRSILESLDVGVDTIKKPFQQASLALSAQILR